MNNGRMDVVFAEVAEALDIPPTAYEKAESRYTDLGAWLGRQDSACSKHSPHVYPQGSFRLGTVVRPLNDKDEYDLDLGCRLRTGISKSTHTQRFLKHLLGRDLEAYRQARGISQKCEEKHRCWRLQYADTLSFHLDAVPSIPETGTVRQTIQEALIREGVGQGLAKTVAGTTGAITDNRHADYDKLCDNWRISNSEGFARWFESRMQQSVALLSERAKAFSASRIEDLPAFRWKSPLQICIQILKRHRDVIFARNPDAKPISAIITTLAARSYRGEASLTEAMVAILSGMDSWIRANMPRVPNPVHPAEDFADKWSDAKYSHLGLEQAFRSWLEKARKDFASLDAASSLDELAAKLEEILQVSVKKPVSEALSKGFFGNGSLLRPAVSVAPLAFPPKPIIPNKPAGFA